MEDKGRKVCQSSREQIKKQQLNYVGLFKKETLQTSIITFIQNFRWYSTKLQSTLLFKNATNLFKQGHL